MRPYNRSALIGAAARFAWVAALVLLLALCGLACQLAIPAQSLAETTNIDAAVSEAQAQVEASAEAYNAASAEVDELQKVAAATQTEVDDIQKRLPAQQEKSDAAVTYLYRMQRERNTFLNLLVKSGSFDNFLRAMDYVFRVQDVSAQEIAQLSKMKASLQEKQDQLASDLEKAKAEEAAAKQKLDEAKELRKKAQAEAEARAAAERAAAEAAAKKAAEEDAKKVAAEKAAKEGEKKAAAEKKAATKQSSDGQKSSKSSSDFTGAVAKPDGANWDSSKSEFVTHWGQRIDAYLAGSALTGKGKVFAEAAWDNGIDPRWSPAISAIESGKGESCYRPHNAWGWGGVSWDSWEEAIKSHVRGLARGYGYTISVDGAKMYCPPNWEHWYSAVSKQMNMI